MHRIATLLLAVTFLLAATSVASAAEPLRVIYETDMCGDVDDVGGLAMLHAMADLGEVEILGVSFNEVHGSGVAAIDAINTWYGRGNIPIGYYNGSLASPDGSDYLGHVDNFNHNLGDNAVTDSVTFYRNVLGAQPDNSVTIISVGFLNNLNDLLRDSEGLALADSKVNKLVAMGGYYNDDYNFYRHNTVSQAEYVIENWPGLLVASQRGHDVLTGAALEGTPAENPVREAYYRWGGTSHWDRSSWDQVAALYAVRGSGEFSEEQDSGNAWLQNGYTWNMTASGDKPRMKLGDRGSRDALENLIEGLMVASPGGPPPSPGPHHWKLDETSGTTAADSVGSMNGTLTGFPSPVPWQNPGLQFAGGGDIDQSGHRVDLGESGALLHDGFTLTMWITPDGVTPPAAYVLYAQREDPDDQDPNRSGLEITTGSVLRWGGPTDDGGGQGEGGVTGTTALTAGQEYFVAVSYSHQGTGTDDLFVYQGQTGDASLTEEGSDDFLYGAGFNDLDSWIGAFPDGNFGFDGVIVDVRTYGVALSMGELEALSGIPEPATLALLGLGGLATLLGRRRRRRG